VRLILQTHSPKHLQDLRPDGEVDSRLTDDSPPTHTYAELTRPKMGLSDVARGSSVGAEAGGSSAGSSAAAGAPGSSASTAAGGKPVGSSSRGLLGGLVGVEGCFEGLSMVMVVIGLSPARGRRHEIKMDTSSSTSSKPAATDAAMGSIALDELLAPSFSVRASDALLPSANIVLVGGSRGSGWT